MSKRTIAVSGYVFVLARPASAATVALCVGGLVLARAVDDEVLARELLDVCRDRAEREIGDA